MNCELTLFREHQEQPWRRFRPRFASIANRPFYVHYVCVTRPPLFRMHAYIRAHPYTDHDETMANPRIANSSLSLFLFRSVCVFTLKRVRAEVRSVNFIVPWHKWIEIHDNGTRNKFDFEDELGISLWASRRSGAHEICQVNMERIGV